MLNLSLKGKSALITGSTSGIGLAIAKTLAEAGANIMLNGFGDAAEIEKTRADLEKTYGIKATYNGADLSTESGTRGLVDETVKALGSVDVLVNNAGIQHTSPIEQFPTDKWNLILNLMLSSPFFAIAQALPYMRKNGFGRIINIASVHGLVASTNKAAYVSAKHGLVGLTKVTALETAKENITCNAICPGWVHTPLVQKQIDDLAAREGLSIEKAQEKLLGEKQPSAAFVTPEQLGNLALFICSDAATQLRGSAWTMDGGWTAQ